MNLPRFVHNPLFDIALLAVLLAAFFGFSLGLRPYSVPSESRYVEIGREMAESGDFVTPRLNYVKYFEKPPLFYWIQAQATKHWGLDFFTARIPTAAFAILLCLVTYGLGHMLYGRLAGWLGAGVLATSLYMFALSRIVLVDVPVSFFIVSALTGFLYALSAPESRKRTIIIYSSYAAAACAVLTKGLIGAVLPGIVIFLWLAFTKRWQVLKTMRLCSGLLLFLAIAVPWHVMVAARNPEFSHFYFIHEHFERYLTKEHGRYQPAWFFLAVFVAGLFPWTIFTWQAAWGGLKGFWDNRLQDGKQLFLLLWILVILVFFSLSDSKLIPYILPIFPPVAALIGGYFARVWQEEKPAAGFGWGVLVMILLLLLMAIAPSVLTGWLDPEDKILVALRDGGDELHVLSVAAMIAGAALLITYIQGRKRHVVLCLIAIAALVMGLGDQVAAHYNSDSTQDFTSIITQLYKPGDEVASYQYYYQDLPIYLKHLVTVVDFKGELEFGTQHQDTSAWMIDGKTFWKRWMKGDHLMFVIMRAGAFEQLMAGKKPEDLHLYFGKKDGRNVMFINRPPETLEDRLKK